MKRILGIFALILPIAASAGWAQEKLSLAEISDYLNGLSTAQAPFTQFNDDGSRSTGMLYLSRPGRMRFEYDPPDSAVVIAGGGAVVIQDPKSNQPPESYPLRRTPLSIILAKTVDLERADMVVGHRLEGNETVITAQDPENPEYGSIELIFSADPVALRRWLIRDGTGGRTAVVLDRLQIGGRLNPTLFAPQFQNGSPGR